MKKIVIASQKGGSGKTTLAAHLAVEAERSGQAPVWMIDTDKQGTLSLWHERRDAETPHRADLPFYHLRDGLTKLAAQGARYCLIDTAPTISDQLRSLVHLADLVLIPVRPSPADLWSVSETLRVVNDSDKPFLFVMTQAKPHALITAQTIAALSEYGQVATHFLADRVAYAAAMTGGKTAPELSSTSPATEEVHRLWEDILSCFQEKMKEGKNERRKK